MASIAAPPQPDLSAALWDAIRAIPTGQVSSYGRIADALGDRSAARWVASELSSHEPAAMPCPCIRIVRQTGQVGGYAHGTEADKAAQLRREGLRLDGEELVDPAFTEPPRPEHPPFRMMRAWQVDVASETLPELSRVPDRVAGLDISYTKSGDAVAACVVMPTKIEPGKPAEVLWSTTIRTPVRVPYVTGYLVFRELPALLAVYEKAVTAGQWPGLAIVDGSGRLHPRKAGVATCFASVTRSPAIGVTKKRLLGRFDEPSLTPTSPQPVIDQEETVGTAHRSPTGGKPVFVSPGEGIAQADADRIVQSLMTVHRVPEPIYWADRISREAATTV